MCGITGYVLSHTTLDADKAANLVQHMNTAIQHRWPDDTGIFSSSCGDSTVWLWHVRLAIIDLSDGGHQVMFYSKDLWAFSAKHQKQLYETEKDNCIAIVFNGELYNFMSIKGKLLAEWYTFSTKSDTEVILAAYDRWWTECVSHFNGMRSFAIYDPLKRQVFCSRDMLWEKPLYYFYDKKKFIFSSELKGILAHDLDLSIDSNALDFYFSVWYIPAPYSIYNNIYKLPARHNLVFDCDSWEVITTQYLELPVYVPVYDRWLLIEEGRSLLQDAVHLRMFADVPVGAFLSWGVDSSTVVSCMTHETSADKIHTFSIGFNWAYDETPYINIVKDAFHTIHHHEYFTQETFQNLLPDISHIYDEPFWDYSHFPTLAVSQLARKHVTVALSGDGGDEIFWWYTLHQVTAQLQLIKRLPYSLRELLHRLIPKSSDNLSFLSKLKEALRLSLLSDETFYGSIAEDTIYRPAAYKQRTEEKIHELLNKNNWNIIQSIIDFDLFYNTLPDNFLTKVDRASMHFALEVRPPFLDPRFLEFGHKIPTERKVNRKERKILMKEMIKWIIPDTIIHRSKQGFKPPLDERITSAPYISYIQTHLPDLLQKKLLDKKRHAFFQSILSRSNQSYNQYDKDYLIKLFLFIDWCKKRGY